MVMNSVQPIFHDWCNPKIFYVVINVRVSGSMMPVNPTPDFPCAFGGGIAEHKYVSGEYNYIVKYRFWNKMFAKWFYNRMNRKCRR